MAETGLGQDTTGSPPGGNEPNAEIPFAVVGIGASAGGLEACGKLLGAMPPMNGMAAAGSGG